MIPSRRQGTSRTERTPIETHPRLLIGKEVNLLKSLEKNKLNKVTLFRVRFGLFQREHVGPKGSQFRPWVLGNAISASAGLFNEFSFCLVSSESSKFLLGKFLVESGFTARLWSPRFLLKVPVIVQCFPQIIRLFLVLLIGSFPVCYGSNKAVSCLF